MSQFIKMMIGDVETEIPLKEDITFSDVLSGINTGVSMCYDESGKYLPEILEFSILYAQISTLTDIDLGVDANSAYAVIRNVDHVPGTDAKYIELGIRQSIEHRTAMTSATICGAGSADVADQMKDITEQINSVLNAANNILQTLMMEVQKNKDIDPKDIMNVLQSLKTPNADLVHSILDYNKAKGEYGAAPKKRATKSVRKTSAK